MERVYPGSIILLHDRLYHVDRHSHADREAMLKAVDLFIGRLATQFRFVTVPELLMYGTPQRRDWNQRVDPEWSKTIEENQF